MTNIYSVLYLFSGDKNIYGRRSMAIVVLISGKAEKCLELRDLGHKTEINGTMSSHSPYVF